MKARAQQGSFTLVAHRGDAKTLLAFDITVAAARKNLAGFTIRVTPPGHNPYYLLNSLRFEHCEQHARVDGESDLSSANAPFHKFRWVHTPGSFHQGITPVWGDYLYEVTPRYFDTGGRLVKIDPALTASVTIKVEPFAKDALALGFTRGFTQSQAFTHHFGKDAKLRPGGKDLQFDTSQQCGISPDTKKPFTFADEYLWSGFTARQRVFDLFDEAVGDPAATLDVFAYDLNEPDVIDRLLKLGGEKRARVILDNAKLHHDAAGDSPEDQFAELFAKAAGAEAIKRGHFGRFAHDKVMILSCNGTPQKVLTGSTNFSITGMYVNSNHVLVFDDPKVAALYGRVFQAVWDQDVKAAAFSKCGLSKQDFTVGSATISFSPHDAARAAEVLNRVVVAANGQRGRPDGLGNVLFAVMELGSVKNNPVYAALDALHQAKDLFSFGISDNPEGIKLYDVGSAEGVIVTGKPQNPVLPPPFNQVRSIHGQGHQIHHKFVVCGFDQGGTVFCGSSNLALTGEQVNGDNLLMIEDPDVATVFAIEALGLVDHFNFLDRLLRSPNAAAAIAPAATPPADLAAAADRGGWYLSTSDDWCGKFFDPNDLHSKDRQIFAR